MGSILEWIVTVQGVQTMRAFISGASTGLGYAMAEKLLKMGCSLILTSKDPERLEEACFKLRVYGPAVESHTADFTIEKDIDVLFQKISHQNIRTEIFINNAGAGYYGSFAEMERNTASKIVQINVNALTIAMKYEMSMMEYRGNIVNISSTAAFQPGPLSAVYYASKSYVYNFTRAVQRENKNRSLKISVACPGPVSTPFHGKAGISNLKGMNVMDADKAAAIIIRGMEHGKKVIIPGFANKTMVYGSRMLPGTLIEYVIERFNRNRID